VNIAYLDITVGIRAP